MSIPNLQNIQNKLFPIINKEMPRYMGQTNFVSKYIPEIFVGVSQGAIGGDLDNTAFNLKNMYGGTSLGDLNIFNEYPKHEARVFKMEPEEYYIGIDINRIEEINELYARDEKKAGEEILNYIAQKLVSRLGLLRERNLAAKVTDASLYGSTNTVDLTAKPISTWTEADIDNFFSSFIDLAKYLNYAVGGNLFNDKMELQDNGQKLYIVIPIDVYIKLQGLFRLFSNYISMIGNDANGKYKAFRPDIFNAVTSGITVVGTAFRVADDHEVEQKYQLENLTDIWTGETRYALLRGMKVGKKIDIFKRISNKKIQYGYKAKYKSKDITKYINVNLGISKEFLDSEAKRIAAVIEDLFGDIVKEYSL